MKSKILFRTPFWVFIALMFLSLFSYVYFEMSMFELNLSLNLCWLGIVFTMAQIYLNDDKKREGGINENNKY